MVELTSIDLNVRTVDLGAGEIDAEVDTSVARPSVDASVSVPVGAAALHIGLDRLLYSTSPIDRLLHSPDPLARYRAGAVPADPSPIMTRGMTARVGDIHAEIATRHDIGGLRTTDTTMRGDVRPSGNDLLTARAATGSDTRGVGAVRDAAETAALPQRIDGAAGATAGERGLRASAAIGIAPAAATGAVAGATIDVSFHGLVNILDRAGAPIATARDTPPGAVLLYARADGSTVVELRTATGFAGASGSSATPLTGTAPGRAGEGYTLIGVFVTGDGPRAAVFGAMPAPSATGPVSPAATTAIVTQPTSASTATAMTAAATGTASATAAVDTAVGASTTAAMQRADSASPPSPRTDAHAAAAVPPPDGSTIPAGQPVAPDANNPSFGEAGPSADATDRPYIHAIWYDILALRFDAAGVALLERSTALRDVVWSTAMEHGPFAAADGSDVLSRVAASLDLTQADDTTIVAALFAERARVDTAGGLVHYPEVLPFDQTRVVDRLADEAELAARRIVGG